jgi:CoA:oxalate CoA-transferase
MKQMFEGITILDVTKVLSGPLATRMLADYGAMVIKIEHPDRPDDSRSYPPLKNGASGYYEVLNRNKKSITLDFTKAADRETFYALSKTADVIVENLPTASKKKLGLDYETIRTINPKLIYATLTGIDPTSTRKYYDVIAQAESGLMSLIGTPENPMKIGPAVVDAFSGMTLAFAIAGALFARIQSGNGTHLTVSMLAAAMNLLEQNLIEASVTGVNPVRAGNLDTAIAPFGVYKTKDSRIVLAAGSPALWEVLASFLATHQSFEKNNFATNEDRLKNNAALTILIESVFIQYETKALLTKLTELGIPAGPVREMQDVLATPWFYESGALQKIVHPTLGTSVVPGHAIWIEGETPKSLQPAPNLGEHNDKL